MLICCSGPRRVPVCSLPSREAMQDSHARRSASEFTALLVAARQAGPCAHRLFSGGQGRVSAKSIITTYVTTEEVCLACVDTSLYMNSSRPNPVFHAAEKPSTLLFAIMYNGAEFSCFYKFC